MKFSRLWKKVLSLGLGAALLTGSIAGFGETTNAAEADGGNVVNEVSETEGIQEFNVNLFKYNQKEINAASKAKAPGKQTNDYLAFGPTNDAAWNTSHKQGVFQGLADSRLTSSKNGMIQFSQYGTSDFFSGNSGSEKTAYYNVPFEFKRTGDMYEFDSAKMSATFSNGKVSIGDANGGFWPFGVGNYYFGMNFGTEFYMTKDGKINGKDIVFEFSGDDDVWVFIDGQLVLDLGGIHGAVAGSINFADGTVTFEDTAPEVDPKQMGAILDEIRDENGNITAGGLMADYITNTSERAYDAENRKYYYVTASYNFYDSDATTLTKEQLTDGKAHELQVYYMERGAGESNCKIQFNLPQTPQQNRLEVSNDVISKVNGLIVPDSTPFTYVIKKNGTPLANETYACQTATGETASLKTNAKGEFQLKDGDKAIFSTAEVGTYQYTVTEALETGYTATYVGHKNEDETSKGGPVTEEQDSENITLEAKHEIVTATNQGRDDVYKIDFVNEKDCIENSLESDKKAVLVNWDERTYKITLAASSTTEFTKDGKTEIIAIQNAKVVDTIDERFELTEDEIKRLTDEGASVAVLENGTTTITWEGQTISAAKTVGSAVTPGWSREIQIRAKDNYFGGNAVATNVNPGSYIEINKNEPQEFEQPKVNVKIKYELTDAKDEIFLGESLQAYFTEDTLNQMMGNVNNQLNTRDIESVVPVWSDKAGNQIDQEAIKKASPSESTEYYLRLKVTPKVLETSAEAIAAAESMNPGGNKYFAENYEEPVGKYIVTVKTGAITITKKINQNAYNNYDGDPIFTYKITNQIDGKVYYRTIRFDVNEEDSYAVKEENHMLSADYYVCSAQITGLPQGLYKVEELDTMGFTLEHVETDVNNTNCLYVDKETYTVYAIGFYVADGKTLDIKDASCLVSGPEDDHLTRDEASVNFINKKIRTYGKETDTDVVKNSLVIGETVSGNYDADNMQQ